MPASRRGGRIAGRAIIGRWDRGRRRRGGPARAGRARAQPRKDVVERLLALLRDGAERGCDLVVFPELALTTFFPRWFVADIAEFDHFYETAMPGPATQPLFDEARAARRRLLPRLRRADRARRRRRAPPLQHPDPRRARRLDRRPLPQGPPARPRGARAGPAVPARRALLLRARPGRVRRVAARSAGASG